MSATEAKLSTEIWRGTDIAAVMTAQAWTQDVNGTKKNYVAGEGSLQKSWNNS